MKPVDPHSAHSLVGRQLGAHLVLARVGAGGMGKVYRARDTQLGREVALKVLPPTFAQDPDRVARFAREARLLAALTHPHIAVLYGFEEHAGRHALVMELVEGSTLSERLLQGPLRVAESIAIARQLTDALDAAHEKGIVHRDLKPSNIKLTPDGTVKVLDFGLAKACEPGGSSEMAESPTVTAAGTRTGTLLGTAAYMSPEQARGQFIDKRADIWAFGCVLYEMLTGGAAFAGETLSDTLAHVLQLEPDWERLPASTPPPVRRLLRRCLEKNPRQRLRDIGDARLDLDESWDDAHEQARGPLVASLRAFALWAVALTVVALVAGAIAWFLKPTSAPVVSRFSHGLAPDAGFVQTTRSRIAVAPDGRSLVYAAGTRLYRRTFDELDAVPIRGTDGAPSAPFFSPEGQTLGYWDAAAGELRRIAVDGGTPVTVTRATALYGANWETDGTIVYGQQDGIWRVQANGGTPEHIVRIDANELVYGPRILPGRTAVLFGLVTRGSMVGQTTAWDTARVVVQTLQTGERREIARGGDARILRTGHLVYALGTVLFAVPFDVERLEVKGVPAPVLARAARESIDPRTSHASSRVSVSPVSRTTPMTVGPRPSRGSYPRSPTWRGLDAKARSEFATERSNRPFEFAPVSMKRRSRRWFIKPQDRTTVAFS